LCTGSTAAPFVRGPRAPWIAIVSSFPKSGAPPCEPLCSMSLVWRGLILLSKTSAPLEIGRVLECLSDQIRGEQRDASDQQIFIILSTSANDG